MWSPHDLIVAAATAPGAGARGIVRVAGQGLTELLERLFSAPDDGFVAAGGRPRAVRARPAADGPLGEWGGLAIDILHWPGPGGPLGGPLAEIQLPAAAPLVDAVVAAACRRGARLAHGGEFSYRGFLAGRIDLLQAEAVLAVVDARTPAELSTALDRLAGGVGRGLDALRESLLDLAADIEAAIDFADEHAPDAVPVADAAAWARIDSGLAAVGATLAALAARLAARDSGGGDLPRVVLAGPPNVGKSSLYNRLVGRDAALVADESGTTRDWLAARIPLAAGGAACLLVDLAGLGGREAVTAVERAAAERAVAEIARADVVVVCRDAASIAAAGAKPAAGSPPDLPPIPPSAARIDVLTRCDLRPEATASGAIRTSSRSGAGLEGLRAAIERAVADLPPRGSPATVRMRAGVSSACDAVAAARSAASVAGERDEAVVAGLVRQAVAALDDVTGRQIGTDLVDRIFARHCIGK